MRKLKRKIKKELSFCKCGCGKRVTQKGNKFLLGHNAKKGNTDSSSNNNHCKFQPGNKFGKGRPQGSRNNVSIAAEKLMEDEAGAITRTAIDMALNGHPQMVKLILERVVPIRKSSPIRLEGMPIVNSVESAGVAAEFILRSITEGRISPIDGECLSRVLSKRLDSLQLVELEKKISEIADRLQ